mmetsp:Transcript_9293/g.20937  ORF Transcript_9293/g.20937 Transcript_9293/m.20937 type:complete len:98 (-) Transcript_9293:598-891(-)
MILRCWDFQQPKPKKKKINEDIVVFVFRAEVEWENEFVTRQKGTVLVLKYSCYSGSGSSSHGTTTRISRTKAQKAAQILENHFGALLDFFGSMPCNR